MNIPDVTYLNTLPFSCLFTNSSSRKADFRKFVRRKPDIDDGGALDDVLMNLTPRQAEEVLEEPVMNHRNYDENILAILKKAVGFSSYPPKYMAGLFFVSILFIFIVNV